MSVAPIAVIPCMAERLISGVAEIQPRGVAAPKASTSLSPKHPKTTIKLPNC